MGILVPGCCLHATAAHSFAVKSAEGRGKNQDVNKEFLFKPLYLVLCSPAGLCNFFSFLQLSWENGPSSLAGAPILLANDAWSMWLANKHHGLLLMVRAVLLRIGSCRKQRAIK